VQKPELLSPAGSMESAIAAINAGADALYVGGKNFSARSSAQNFADAELVDLIEYAAIRGVGVYVAVNTLYKNTEISQVVEFASQMHCAGATAFILQDAGLAYILRSKMPQIEIHASTQMSVHSTEGVNFMQKMGFSRVVLARELSLVEVAEINAITSIETEVFVHGALCVSYSGQCLMSSLIGGRSGNRGRCAQICRTRFDLVQGGKSTKNGYLLSPKDMMALDILPDIVATGVASLKIEGRMKSPEYVYLVTKAYREKLDDLNKPVSEQTRQELLQIFNRGGSFTTGYYNMYHGESMMSTVTPKSTGVLAGEVLSYVHKGGKCRVKFSQTMQPGDGIEIWTRDGNHVGTGISRTIGVGDVQEFAISGAIEKGCKVYKSYDKGLVDRAKNAMAEGRKVKVQGSVRSVAGEPLSLTLAGLTATGHPVEIAKSTPLAASDIIAQLMKTGGTPFEMEFTDVKIDDNIFVSKGELNQLRRSALEKLEADIVASIKRQSGNLKTSELLRQSCEHCPQHTPCNDGVSLSVQISDIASLPMVMQHHIPRVYVNYNAVNIAQLPSILGNFNTKIYLALPQICRNTTEKAIVQTLQQLENTAISGYLVSTYGQLQALQAMKIKKHIILDHTFNIFNDWTVEYFSQMGLGITLSQELNVHEIKAMQAANFELVVYGRQTLMATHNAPGCVGKMCGKPYTLRDRKGMCFPIKTDCQSCTSYLLNCKTLDTAGKFAQLKNTGASSFRLVFTTENGKEIGEVIRRYKNSVGGKLPPTEFQDTTYGHFFRGVE